MSSCMVKETGRSRQAMQSTRSVLRCVLVSAPRCATRDSRSVEAAALHKHAHVHAQAQAHATATERMLVRAKLQTRNRRYRSLVRQKPQRRLGPLQKRASTTRTTRRIRIPGGCRGAGRTCFAIPLHVQPIARANRRICRRETRLRLPRQVVRGARDLSPRSSRRDGGRHRGRSGVRVVRRH